MVVWDETVMTSEIQYDEFAIMYQFLSIDGIFMLYQEDGSVEIRKVFDSLLVIYPQYDNTISTIMMSIDFPENIDQMHCAAIVGGVIGFIDNQEVGLFRYIADHHPHTTNQDIEAIIRCCQNQYKVKRGLVFLDMLSRQTINGVLEREHMELLIRFISGDPSALMELLEPDQDGFVDQESFKMMMTQFAESPGQVRTYAIMIDILSQEGRVSVDTLRQLNSTITNKGMLAMLFSLVDQQQTGKVNEKMFLRVMTAYGGMFMDHNEDIDYLKAIIDWDSF